MPTITISGQTWTTQTMPTDPIAPASFEFQHNAIVASSTNPFNAKQQMFNWNAAYKECSVSYASMTISQGQTWAVFLESLNGQLDVFRFSDALIAVYVNELTTDGSTPRYWRLKTNQVKWSVKEGSVYGVSFELREVV
jgi:hypothetical protein